MAVAIVGVSLRRAMRDAPRAPSPEEVAAAERRAALPRGAGETPEPAAAPSPVERAEGALPPLPGSLQGTEVDGALVADASGHFQPGPEALRLFDYFLSARGEEGAATIRARIEAQIAERLPPSARDEALRLYDTYLLYLDEASRLVSEGTAVDDMEQRFQELRELRRQVFGSATARALFEEAEQIEEVALERRRIMSDPDLNDRERIQRLAELQNRLPEDVRRAEAEAYAPLRLAREEDRLREQGASEAEIRALREQMVGEDAAQRLEDLDRDRAAWSERMAAYRKERDEVLYSVRNAPEEAKVRFLRRVRERHFEPHERPRVEALDRIELRERSLGRVPVDAEGP